MTIRNQEELRELYGWPRGRAKIKVLDKLDPVSKHFLAHVPFAVLSTFDKEGWADASPRGGKAGFIHIWDETTILIPDAKGNNRVDSLVNIVETGSVGLLCLIPGIDETLRINGKASISTAENYLKLFADERIPPKTCIEVKVSEVFLHCAKALMRSKLWHDDYRQSRPGFPTMGRMLNEQLKTNNPEETQEEMIERYKKDL